MPDEHGTIHMREALDLARLGKGRVEPNPMVGCVIARGGSVVGRGWHRAFGGDHAEVEALTDAGPRAEGADVFVTLEPCAHHGKTPPCVDALIRAKVGRVFAAMADAFPQTSGLGPARLSEAGIPYHVGLLDAEARDLNAPYLKLVTRGESYIIAKWAMSLDGRIATRTGESRWISGEESRRLVHEMRNVVDAVVVGLGTVLRDDPALTCRLPGGRNPVRIVVDSACRISQDANLVRTARETRTIIAATDAAPEASVRAIEAAGCEIMRLPSRGGRVSLAGLAAETGRMRMTNLLVEGGGEVLASAFEEGIVDEVRVFVAPVIIGGSGAPSPVGGAGAESLAQAQRLGRVTARAVGVDVLIEGKVGPR